MTGTRCFGLLRRTMARPWLCCSLLALTGPAASAGQSAAGYEVFAHIARLSTAGMVERVRTTQQIEQGAAIESILYAAGLARMVREGMGPDGTLGLDNAESSKVDQQVRVFNELLLARGINARIERVELEGASTFRLTGGSGSGAITIDVGPDLREWADNPLHVSVLEQLGMDLHELTEDGRFGQALNAATGEAVEQDPPPTISSQCTVGSEGCTLAAGCTTSKCTSGSCTSSTGCTQDSCTAGSCTSGTECTVGDGCTKGGDCTAGKNCTGSDSCTKGEKCTRGGNCTGSNSCTSGSEACTFGSECTGSSGGMCTRGPACTAGSECTGGNNCSTGTHCTQGNGGCTLGGKCTTGEFCSMGNHCTSGGGTHACTEQSCSDAARCTYSPCTNATKCTDGSACSNAGSYCAPTYQQFCTLANGCTGGSGCPPQQQSISMQGGTEPGSALALAGHSFTRVKTFMTSDSQAASFAWMGLLLIGMSPFRRSKAEGQPTSDAVS